MMQTSLAAHCLNLCFLMRSLLPEHSGGRHGGR